MHVCIVCVYTCVHASMCICMYVYMYACVHTCMYICNFLFGFLSGTGGIVLVGRGNCPGEVSGGIDREGKCPFPTLNGVALCGSLFSLPFPGCKYAYNPGGSCGS